MFADLEEDGKFGASRIADQGSRSAIETKKSTAYPVPSTRSAG